MDTSKSNLTIALFMGAKVIGEYLGSKGGYTDSQLLDFGGKDVDYPANSRFWGHTTLKYHLLWDWLMPVVIKLKSEKKGFISKLLLFRKLNKALNNANISRVYLEVVSILNKR